MSKITMSTDWHFGKSNGRFDRIILDGIKAQCEHAKKHKIKTLWLAVWVGNDKAIRFYEKHGFHKETKYHYDFESMSFDYEVMVKEF